MAPPDLLGESLDHLRQGLLVLDSEQRVAYVNASYRALFGWPAGEPAPGLSYERVLATLAASGAIGPGDAAEMVAERLRPVRERQPRSIERSTPGGRTLHVQGAPLPGGGYVLTFDDITERRQRDDMRRAKEAAEAASAAKSVFLANISHELRTPLNAILGYAEMLIEAECGPLSADLAKIQVAGRHLLAIIDDMLDLSRIEAGVMGLAPETFDLAALVGEVCDWVRPVAAHNADRLLVEAGDGLGDMHSDRVKLRQIFLNLVGNAAKFTRGGVVRWTLERVAEDGREWLVAAVYDTGIGMTAEEVEKAIHPFTQADDTTTRRHGGTGLGLTIARNYCRMLGGGLDIHSRAGDGTVVRVRLPMTLDGITAERAAAGQVLVVDDDPTTRSILRRLLEKDGWRVSEACNGQEALERLDRVRPAVILVDLMMPVMDGFSFMAEVKRRPPAQTIPLIVLTAKDLTADESHSLDGLAQVVLRKGNYSRSDLLTALRGRPACN